MKHEISLYKNQKLWKSKSVITEKLFNKETREKK